MYLSDLLRDKLERLTRRKTSLTVEEKVMIALRFFASGSHLQVIGDTMGICIFVVTVHPNSPSTVGFVL
jgi:hypothetical protein